MFDAELLRAGITGRRTLFRQRRMFNVIHEAFAIKVDLIVVKDDPYAREAFRRRRQMTVLDRGAVWWRLRRTCCCPSCSGRNKRAVQSDNCGMSTTSLCIRPGSTGPTLIAGHVSSVCSGFSTGEAMTERELMDGDTDSVAAEVMRRSVMRLTPVERFMMGCEMFDAARTLARAGLAVQGFRAGRDVLRAAVPAFLRGRLHP